MFYVTGDTHGDFSRYEDFMRKNRPRKKDALIILGDAALNYFKNERDTDRKRYVNSFPFTTFCIYGNHELRPEHVTGCVLVEYHGGLAWQEPDFPNILYAEDGEIYDFDGMSCIAIGGAYSIDRDYRMARGYPWFEDEQPSEKTKRIVEQRLSECGWTIGAVLSHTCPLKYEPTDSFLTGYDQTKVDRSTEKWLDGIEDRLSYTEWFCGHFHTDRKRGNVRFMKDRIVPLREDTT